MRVLFRRTPCFKIICIIYGDKQSPYSLPGGLDLSSGVHLIQGMVDGSASKPALRQDTGYMVEKTYLDIAPYLGAFGAYLMPQ